jgi:hypothetical protein
MHVLMSMKSVADVSLVDEGKAAREHAMSALVGSARGDGDDKSKYGVPHLAAKREGCATTGIGGTTEGDGDDKSKYGVPHSAAKREGCATNGIGGATQGDGDGETKGGVAESTTK